MAYKILYENLADTEKPVIGQIKTALVFPEKTAEVIELYKRLCGKIKANYNLDEITAPYLLDHLLPSAEHAFSDILIKTLVSACPDKEIIPLMSPVGSGIDKHGNIVFDKSGFNDGIIRLLVLNSFLVKYVSADSGYDQDYIQTLQNEYENKPHIKTAQNIFECGRVFLEHYNKIQPVIREELLLLEQKEAKLARVKEKIALFLAQYAEAKKLPALMETEKNLRAKKLGLLEKEMIHEQELRDIQLKSLQKTKDNIHGTYVESGAAAFYTALINETTRIPAASAAFDAAKDFEKTAEKLRLPCVQTDAAELAKYALPAEVVSAEILAHASTQFQLQNKDIEKRANLLNNLMAVLYQKGRKKYIFTTIVIVLVISYILLFQDNAKRTPEFKQSPPDTNPANILAREGLISAGDEVHLYNLFNNKISPDSFYIGFIHFLYIPNDFSKLNPVVRDKKRAQKDPESNGSLIKCAWPIIPEKLFQIPLPVCPLSCLDFVLQDTGNLPRVINPHPNILTYLKSLGYEKLECSYNATDIAFEMDILKNDCQVNLEISRERASKFPYTNGGLPSNRDLIVYGVRQNGEIDVIWEPFPRQMFVFADKTSPVILTCGFDVANDPIGKIVVGCELHLTQLDQFQKNYESLELYCNELALTQTFSMPKSTFLFKTYVPRKTWDFNGAVDPNSPPVFNVSLYGTKGEIKSLIFAGKLTAMFVIE